MAKKKHRKSFIIGGRKFSRRQSFFAAAIVVALGFVAAYIFAFGGSYTITAYSPRGGSDWRASYDAKHPCRFVDDGRVTYTAKTSITQTCPVEGTTAAVDTAKIPGFSTMCISGIGTRIAQDRGGSVNGSHIDVFFNSQHAALQYGTHYLVKVVPGRCGTSGGGGGGGGTSSYPYGCSSEPTLRSGSSGSCVKKLQYILVTVADIFKNPKEYPGPASSAYSTSVVDGAFGTNTKNAVIEFQKQRGLTGDGVVGPNTWSKIDIECGKTTRC